jgi:hypothetical protein
MTDGYLVKMVNLMIIGVVISGSFYYFRDELGAPFRKSEPVRAAPAPWPWPQPAPPPSPAPPARAAHRDKQDREAKPVTQAGLIMRVLVGPRPLPTPSDIPAHMALAEVVEKFGEPDMTVTWVYDGKLNRKVVYEDGPAALDIYVQNGYVVSATRQ